MKNKILACTRDHSRCNRHILFYIIFVRHRKDEFVEKTLIVFAVHNTKPDKFSV